MKKPNILHICTDQQRFDTIRALGNPVIRTPNLDWLCETGTAFTHAYSPSPVCVPARCSMHYGQYPLNTGCYDNGAWPMPTDDRESFVGALTRSGYRTHGTGKFHFTPDPDAPRGFETRDTGDAYGSWLREQGNFSGNLSAEMYYIPQPATVPQELHVSHWVGNRTVDFIQEQSGGGKPWYFYSSFRTPHPPFAPPAPWNQLYRASLMPFPYMPEGWETLQAWINKAQNRYKYCDQGVGNNLLRCMKAYYYAEISFIDFQLGRMLDALRATGQLENTLILYTSDHGELLGDYGCFGKRSMHDASARIPFIVRMPGRFEGGATCDIPVSLVDVASTFLGAAGASLESHKPDGVDVADLLSGESSRTTVFSQFCASPRWFAPCMDQPVDSGDLVVDRAHLAIYMAVDREWKYVYSAPDNREFLFDKVNDPQESRNRVAVSFCREAATRMKATLIDHLREGGETGGIEGESWKEFRRIGLPVDPDQGLLVQGKSRDRPDLPGYST